MGFRIQGLGFRVWGLGPRPEAIWAFPNIRGLPFWGSP